MVHGAVGVAQDFFMPVCFGRAHGEADAGGAVCFVLFKPIGCVEGREEFFGGSDGLLGGTDVAEEDDEFIAAEPSGDDWGIREVGGVGQLEEITKPVRDGDQEKVSDIVSEAVVDDLESVEVDKEQGELEGGVGGFFSSLGEKFIEAGAIGEPGEFVGEGNAAEFRRALMDHGFKLVELEGGLAFEFPFFG